MTSRCVVQLWKKKKIYNTVFTGVHHCCMFCVRGTRPTPSYFVSLRFILIFSSYLCQDLPSNLFPSKFSHKNYLCISNLFAPSPLYSHFITLIKFADNYIFGSSLLFIFLHPVSPSPPFPLSCGLGAEYSHQQSFLKLFTLFYSPDVKG